MTVTIDYSMSITINYSKLVINQWMVSFTFTLPKYSTVSKPAKKLVTDMSCNWLLANSSIDSKSGSLTGQELATDMYYNWSLVNSSIGSKSGSLLL